jgi:hypothetical protein
MHGASVSDSDRIRIARRNICWREQLCLLHDRFQIEGVVMGTAGQTTIPDDRPSFGIWRPHRDQMIEPSVAQEGRV